MDVRSALEGTIDRVSLPAGAHVRAGQVLFRIDPTPYRQESERRYIARTQALARLEFANASRIRALRAADGNLPPPPRTHWHAPSRTPGATSQRPPPP